MKPVLQQVSYYVRHFYRSGEWPLAEHYLARLDSLYGSGAPIPNPKYRLPLDVFAEQETFEQYDQQPFLAPSEVAAALRHGLRMLGRGRKDVFEQALQFADTITTFFDTNRYQDFETKMGTGRLKDLIGTLENSLVTVCGQLMVDTTLRLLERLTIYRSLPPDLQLAVYDTIWPEIARQLQASDMKGVIPISDALPEPPGIEEYRRQRALEESQRQEAGEAQTERK